MKRLITILIAILAMAGCTTNGVYDSGKTWALVGGIVIGGAVVANADSKSAGSNCYWAVSANGSRQVCQ